MKSNIISIVLSTLIVAIIVECTSVDNCVTDPTTPSCVNYELPGAIVTADVDDLCTQMPFMIGCSVENMCESSSIESSIYCAKFSIYKDLCLDMPKMSGCSDYTSMCGNGSVVKECETAVVGFPSTMQTQSYITSICDQMTMAGCTECTADMSSCDLLSTYSSLCKAMPDMTQCAAWKSYCVNIPDWDICSYSSADSPPEMRMYFHTGILDYILFKEWVPRTVGSYAGSCIAVFVMGFLSEAIKAFRCYCDKMWKKQSGGYSQRKFYHISLDVDVPRAIFRLVEYTYAMLVMLVIMTYNVGLFICVCAGVGVGNLFMGRYMNYEEQPEDASCCC